MSNEIATSSKGYADLLRTAKEFFVPISPIAFAQRDY